jgi:hypothetical protein
MSDTPIKHAVISRARFSDKALMHKYLKVSKDMLIPSLQAQTNSSFTWFVMTTKEDIGFMRDYFGVHFVPVLNLPDFVEHMKDGKYTIQTRHDIDDWMAPTYIDEIQKLYTANIGTYDKFLIQSQPIKLMYHTGEESVMGRYHSTKTSMFLSLCQKEVDNHILEKKHGFMWEIAYKVFNVPDGMTKWVIHGDNISCNRPKNWTFSKTQEK